MLQLRILAHVQTLNSTSLDVNRSSHAIRLTSLEPRDNHAHVFALRLWFNRSSAALFAVSRMCE